MRAKREIRHTQESWYISAFRWFVPLTLLFSEGARAASDVSRISAAAASARSAQNSRKLASSYGDVLSQTEIPTVTPLPSPVPSITPVSGRGGYAEAQGHRGRQAAIRDVAARKVTARKNDEALLSKANKKDYRVVKTGGEIESINQIRTALIGEQHGVCDKPRFILAKEIARGRDPDKVFVLNENARFDQEFDCAEIGVQSIASTCRGWNAPEKSVYGKCLVMEYEGINDKNSFHLSFDAEIEKNKLAELTIEKQISMIQSGLERHIKEKEDKQTSHQKKHNEAYSRYKHKKPMARFEDFDSPYALEVDMCRMNINFLQEMLFQFKQAVEGVLPKGWSPVNYIRNLIVRNINHASDQFHQKWREGGHDMERQNAYLLRSIENIRAAHPDATIIVFAGNSHVDEHFEKQRLSADAAEVSQNAARNLRVALDERVEEDPDENYAILSCTRTR